MKILVANLGSTSLKWRLFDFARGQEQMLHKGGFERVTDYAKAIEDCLEALKTAGHITGDADLAVDILAPLLGQIRSGALRPLAVASARRSAILPELPVDTARWVMGEGPSIFGRRSPGATIDAASRRGSPDCSTSHTRAWSTGWCRRRTSRTRCMPEATVVLCARAWLTSPTVFRQPSVVCRSGVAIGGIRTHYNKDREQCRSVRADGRGEAEA